MIAVVSSHARERAAFAALCESRRWPSIDCDTVQAATRSIRRHQPKVILVRHKLDDGFSDDVIATAEAGGPGRMKIIVLMGAGTTATAEARQLALGADCVQRDPIRIEVLAEYLSKFLKSSRNAGSHARKTTPSTVPFAGGIVDPLQRTLAYRAKSTALTPREVQLIELLVSTAEGMFTYDQLYTEILGRRFRGDTSNMRVLLRKLSTSAQSVGIALRQWIEVIPKTGYRYLHASSENLPPAKRRGGRLLTAA